MSNLRGLKTLPGDVDVRNGLALAWHVGGTAAQAQLGLQSAVENEKRKEGSGVREEVITQENNDSAQSHWD